jgi:hypothetical protein
MVVTTSSKRKKKEIRNRSEEGKKNKTEKNAEIRCISPIQMFENVDAQELQISHRDGMLIPHSHIHIQMQALFIRASFSLDFPD